jgi:hypothetical protein
VSENLSSREHETCHHAIALIGALERAEKAEAGLKIMQQRMTRLEAALEAVTKELDRATEHLRDMLNGYPEPSRCRERVRLWVAARDAAKEGT